MNPSSHTVKRLFAVSSNRCAFPRCKTPLVDSGGKVTGRICHIRARSPKGPRYDPSRTDLERNAFENLLLLCPIHHDVVDADTDSYTVDRLVSMKREHEQMPEPVPVSPVVIEQLILNSIADITQNNVTSHGQYGGITAGAVNIYHGRERSSADSAIELQQHLAVVRDFLGALPTRDRRHQADRFSRSVVVVSDFHIDGMTSAARAFGPSAASTATDLIYLDAP